MSVLFFNKRDAVESPSGNDFHRTSSLIRKRGSQWTIDFVWRGKRRLDKMKWLRKKTHKNFHNGINETTKELINLCRHSRKKDMRKPTKMMGFPFPRVVCRTETLRTNNFDEILNNDKCPDNFQTCKPIRYVLFDYGRNWKRLPLGLNTYPLIKDFCFLPIQNTELKIQLHISLLGLY